jgi:D-cysteine desulfhydrase
MTVPIPLHARWPRLVDSIPHLSLTAGPTPVQRLARLPRPAGAPEAFIKRDDFTASPYGGNKPRKLEFLLAEARGRGSRRILTVGGTGSNHCLATSLHGSRNGFEVELLLIPQPVTDHVRMSLRLYAKHAAAMHLGSSYEHAPRVEAERRREHPTLFYIPIGGSTPLGALGFVNASLELADQVRAGLLPEPARLIVAAGTCGTLAGLVLGLALAGLRTRVTGIRVVDRAVTNPATVLQLVEGARDLLGPAVPEIAGVHIRDGDFDIDERFYGAGYGHPTTEGQSAIELFRETESLPLEPTYTGKTAAALLDALSVHGERGPLLYWHTFAGPVLQAEAQTVPDSAVPERFRQFLS